jgi:hypothetical protein
VVSVVAPTKVDINEYLEVDMGTVMAKDMVEEAIDPSHVSIAKRLVMSNDFTLNCVQLVHIGKIVTFYL